jgi:hypothetical protein
VVLAGCLSVFSCPGLGLGLSGKTSDKSRVLWLLFYWLCGRDFPGIGGGRRGGPGLRQGGWVRTEGPHHSPVIVPAVCGGVLFDLGRRANAGPAGGTLLKLRRDKRRVCHNHAPVDVYPLMGWHDGCVIEVFSHCCRKAGAKSACHLGLQRVHPAQDLNRA